MNPITEQLNGKPKAAYNQAKGILDDKIDEAKSFAHDLADKAEVAEEKLKEYTDVATKFIKENPGTVALVAAGVGVLVGGLLFRRSKSLLQ